MRQFFANEEEQGIESSCSPCWDYRFAQAIKVGGSAHPVKNKTHDAA
jgi:hypothetical protein